MESGISETPFIRRGDSAYVIVEGPTWEEAEANANALGGHLVTINNAEENEWVYREFGIGKWIGLNDVANEGEFVWSSGEEFKYENWYSGTGQINQIILVFTKKIMYGSILISMVSGMISTGITLKMEV